MGKIYAWKTGASMAVGVGVGYCIVTLIFIAWPGAGTAFRDSLAISSGFFDGATRGWSPSNFLYALALILAFFFTAGAVFAWMHAFLHRSDTQEFQR